MFELQDERAGRKTELGSVDADDRGGAHERSEAGHERLDIPAADVGGQAGLEGVGARWSTERGVRFDGHPRRP